MQSQLTFTFSDFEREQAPTSFYVDPLLSVNIGEFEDLRDALEAGSNALIQRGAQTRSAGLVGGITPDEPYDSVTEKLHISLVDDNGNSVIPSLPAPLEALFQQDNYNADFAVVAVDELVTQLLLLTVNRDDTDWASVGAMYRGNKRA